jgi:hypothetical protein
MTITRGLCHVDNHQRDEWSAGWALASCLHRDDNALRFCLRAAPDTGDAAFASPFLNGRYFASHKPGAQALVLTGCTPLI